MRQSRSLPDAASHLHHVADEAPDEIDREANTGTDKATYTGTARHERAFVIRPDVAML
jgi:hypothetical protein